MSSIISALDADVLQDLGISPNHAEFFPCPKCGVDITDYDSDETAAHIRFHQYAEAGLKSIPHQGPQPKLLEEFPRHDHAGWDWR